MTYSRGRAITWKKKKVNMEIQEKFQSIGVLHRFACNGMASKGPIYFDEPVTSEDDSGEDQPLEDEEVVSGFLVFLSLSSCQIIVSVNP